jgi:hypothetical protein
MDCAKAGINAQLKNGGCYCGTKALVIGKDKCSKNNLTGEFIIEKI